MPVGATPLSFAMAIKGQKRGERHFGWLERRLSNAGQKVPPERLFAKMRIDRLESNHLR
jgi:hypothetical protein